MPKRRRGTYHRAESTSSEDEDSAASSSSHSSPRAARRTSEKEMGKLHHWPHGSRSRSRRSTSSDSDSSDSSDESDSSSDSEGGKHRKAWDEEGLLGSHKHDPGGRHRLYIELSAGLAVILIGLAIYFAWRWSHPELSTPTPVGSATATELPGNPSVSTSLSSASQTGTLSATVSSPVSNAPPSAPSDSASASGSGKPSKSTQKSSATSSQSSATASSSSTAGFVSRKGQALYLNGKEFRLAGPNIYWLGLDENVVPNPSYPSNGRIREAFAIAAAMGANTVRAHTLGISTGHSLSIMTDANKVNQNAFASIDYAIYAAAHYGIKLIIPLSDQYDFYTGGKADFVKWGGQSDVATFYTDSTVLAAFKKYINTVLTHTNNYTGLALKDDPTIMAWETGNEYGAYMLKSGPPPAKWTDEIATYIKSLAPNHLVADGTDGIFDESGTLKNTGVGLSSVDLVTDHLYPASTSLLAKDIKAVTDQVFYIGELDWVGQKGGSKLSDYYAALEAAPHVGSMMWSVFGHDDQCQKCVQHNDGYTLSYGSGQLTSEALALIQHWHRLTGNTSTPSNLPAVACPQPEITGKARR